MNHTRERGKNEALTVTLTYARSQARELVRMMAWDSERERWEKMPVALDTLRRNFVSNCPTRNSFWGARNDIEAMETVEENKTAAFAGAFAWLMSCRFITVEWQDWRDPRGGEVLFTLWEATAPDTVSEFNARGLAGEFNPEKITINRAQFLLMPPGLPVTCHRAELDARDDFPFTLAAKAANDETYQAQANS